MARRFPFPQLFRRPPAQPEAPSAPVPATDAREDVLGSDEEFLETMYWLVLGRKIDEPWRKTRMRNFELGQSREAVLHALFASSEFRARYHGYHDVSDLDVAVPGEDALEPGLRTLGTDRAFLQAAYLCLLGRDPDEGGLTYYLGKLQEQTDGRSRVAYSMLQSQEFADRFRALCPAGGRVPVDVQLCELANPAKWDNPDWRRLLDALRLPADKKLAMHRKAYEFTQCAWGLTRLGALTENATVLSVGAGHESLAYWLANRVRSVVATDLFPGAWEASAGAEGDTRVIKHPEEFAPFPYRQDHLRFLQMDGRKLAFRDGAFTIVYSLSSVEHFGGWQGARAAVEEMTRVLAPGGILALATEWHVAGPPAPPEDNLLIFSPADVRALIDHPALELVEPIDDGVWRRYEAAPVDLNLNRYETPHMLVSINGTVFTSVMVFLRRLTTEN